jgi:hypothetical protein
MGEIKFQDQTGNERSVKEFTAAFCGCRRKSYVAAEVEREGERRINVGVDLQTAENVFRVFSAKKEKK